MNRTLIPVLLLCLCTTPALARNGAFAFETAEPLPLPILDGSTSAFPLLLHVAATRNGLTTGWPSFAFHGGSIEAHPFATVYLHPDLTPEELRERGQVAWSVQSNVRKSGTHQAYENLIHGNAEFILVAREPSGDEKALPNRTRCSWTSAPWRGMPSSSSRTPPTRWTTSPPIRSGRYTRAG